MSKDSQEYLLILNRKIEDLLYGWNFILDLKKDCREAAVLLINKESLEIKESVLKYLDSFIAMYPKVFILTTIEMEELYLHENENVIVKRIDENEMEKIILYATSMQDPNMRIVTLTIPNVRNANCLRGFKGIDDDTIVCRGIYGIVGEINGE